MAQTLFGERRTRSQLTLPDDLLFHLPQGSPMKDARLARRFLSQDTIASQPDKSAQQHMLYTGHSGTNELRPKRSKSPAPEEEILERHSEPPPGRGAKRAKREPEAVEKHDLASRRRNGSATRHARMASDPSVTRTRRSARKRSPAAVDRVKPSSFTGETTSSGAGLVSVNERARSVPLFPASYPFPFIDFKNPPPSPRRGRSRSPEKDNPKLEIRIPSITPDVVSDENGDKMDVEEDNYRSNLPEKMNFILQPTDQTTTEPANQVPSKQITATPLVNDHVPITPTISRRSSVPLSPLTPIPETPCPARWNEASSQAGHINEPHADSEDWAQSTNTETGWLMSSADILERTVSPQSNSRPTHTGNVEPPHSSSQATASGIDSSLTITGSKSSGSNAFSLLIQSGQARNRSSYKPGHDKGKQRADVGLTKSSLATSSAKANKVTEIWKDDGLGPSGIKNKVKSRMRPKEKRKAKAVPNVTVPEESAVPDVGQTDSDSRAPRDSSLTIPIKHASAMMPLTREAMSKPSAQDNLTPSFNDTDDQSQFSRTVAGGHLLESLVVEPLTQKTAPEPSVEENLALGFNLNDQSPFSTTILGVDMPEPPTLREAGSSSLSPQPSSTEFTANASPDAAAPGGKLPETVQVDNNPSLPTQNLLAPPIEPTKMTKNRRLQSTLNSYFETVNNPSVPTDRTGKNTKLRLPRKKAPTSIMPASRVTRSAASKFNAKEATRPAPQATTTPVTPSRTRSSSAMGHSSKPDQATTNSTASDEFLKTSSVDNSVPRTPTRHKSPTRKSVGSNYAKPTTSSAAKVTRTPKTPRSSPAKLGRTSSIPAYKLSNTSSRPFTMGSVDQRTSEGPSSLSTLSNALEKLRMPVPSRPNTSLGFSNASEDCGTSTKYESDSNAGNNLTSSTVTRLRRRSSSFNIPSSSSTTASKSSVQQPISLFLSSKQDPTSTTANWLATSATKPAVRRKMFGITGGGTFGMGMRRGAPKVSRKTSLPMVVASPVKGEGAADAQNDNDDDDPTVVDEMDTQNRSLEIVVDSTPKSESLGPDDYVVPIAGGSPPGIGKKQRDGSESWKNSSRRVSLISLALSESLNALPPKGSMGPPSIPWHGRVTRSISNSHASTSQSTSPAEEKMGDMSDVKLKSHVKGSSPNASLGFMKDCVVFVDVRTDDGDDAGSLFVEMLEGAGAKVLTRVGQTCTHIVFKNGLLSTMTRYRLLRDPKPFVVGIAWIVECIEQRKLVDETTFLVDPIDMNTTGANKRRRSLLPKLAPLDLDDANTHDINNGHDEDGDQSMDGSNSSLILDDLPPLERARRRKSFMVGARP